MTCGFALLKGTIPFKPGSPILSTDEGIFQIPRHLQSSLNVILPLGPYLAQLQLLLAWSKAVSCCLTSFPRVNKEYVNLCELFLSCTFLSITCISSISDNDRNFQLWRLATAHQQLREPAGIFLRNQCTQL